MPLAPQSLGLFPTRVCAVAHIRADKSPRGTTNRGRAQVDRRRGHYRPTLARGGEKGVGRDVCGAARSTSPRLSEAGKRGAV